MKPVRGIANAQVSSPGLTGRPSNPGDAVGYWIPAFAGMTPEIWRRVPVPSHRDTPL